MTPAPALDLTTSLRGDLGFLRTALMLKSREALGQQLRLRHTPNPATRHQRSPRKILLYCGMLRHSAAFCGMLRYAAARFKPLVGVT